MCGPKQFCVLDLPLLLPVCNLFYKWFVVVQLLSHVPTPWTAECQASLYFTISEFAQTHIHWVSDTIQPSHLLPSPFSFASVFPSISYISTYIHSLFLNFGLFFVFKIYLCICFWVHWVFVAVQGLSLVAASGGYSLVDMHRLLTVVASLVVEHELRWAGFSGCGTQA